MLMARLKYDLSVLRAFLNELNSEYVACTYVQHPKQLRDTLAELSGVSTSGV
jgi:hypothetical protein